MEDVDERVAARIQRAIDDLEHDVPPTLSDYKKFLEGELVWIATESERRGVVATSPLYQ